MKNILKNKNITIPLLIALILSGLTVGLTYLLGFYTYEMDNVPVRSVPMAIISLVYILAYFALCIVFRKKRFGIALKGMLIYQLIGVAASVFHFFYLQANETAGLYSFFIQIFYRWTLIYHEGGLFLVSIFHFPVRYILMLALGMLAYVTAASYAGIKKDIEFENKIKDRHHPEGDL